MFMQAGQINIRSSQKTIFPAIRDLKKEVTVSAING